MTALTPLIEADLDFEFGPYRLQPYQRTEEVRAIEQGPYSTAQGVLVNRLPGGRAVIRCNGEFKSGKLIRRAVKARAQQ